MSVLSWGREEGKDTGKGGEEGGLEASGASSCSRSGGCSASMLLPWLERPLLLVEGALTMIVGMGIELLSVPASCAWPPRGGRPATAPSSTFGCLSRGPLPAVLRPVVLATACCGGGTAVALAVAMLLGGVALL